MYANLKVTVKATPGTAYLEDETYFAWRVTSGPDQTIIHLDAQDGSGNYAEPDGKYEIEPWRTVVIDADF